MTAEEKRQNLRYNPHFFVEDILGDTIWSKQVEIVDSVTKHPRTSVRSCHGSGKTFISARVVLKFMNSWAHSIAITTAPTFPQVRDLLWKEIRTAHANAKYKLPGKISDTRYEIGEDWYALGRSTDESSNFQGYHAPYVLVVVDEACGVASLIYEAIEGIISTGYARLLLIGNPTDPTSLFFNTFKSEIYNKIHISCFHTPNFDPFRIEVGGQLDMTASLLRLQESTKEERLDAIVANHLITPQWALERLDEWGMTSPMFQSRVLGEFPTEGEDTLFPMALFDKCVRGTKVGDETKENFGVDIARFGSDKTVMVYTRGNKVESIVRYQKEDTMQTTGRIVQFHNIHPYAVIKPDDAGVGGGVVDRLHELNLEKKSMKVAAINVGEGSNHPDQFVNLRAEYFWGLRMRAEQGDLILPDDDKLRSDLCSIKYKINSRGQILIESKDDMKKRGLPSPDSADAVMLAFAPAAARGSAYLDYYAGIATP